MALSWNEIKDRALHFSKEWADTSNEEADSKPFLIEFFEVFGITRKRVSTFEHKVKKLDESNGYIDLLWKGTILIEMKSRGKNLDKAYQQAVDYTYGLKQHELPKYILICDFETFRLYDLEENKTVEFKLNDLVNNVQHFGYILGYQKNVYKEQDPANIQAAELMGKLHDRLKEIGYEGHPLEVYLVRLLFCLFAEDTTIFDKQAFQDYIEQRTNVDGSDLASKLQELFQVLNTPFEKRFKNIDEQLNEFPYVNGKLFEEVLPVASFDTKMRQALLDCCIIDWSKISPAIFGSMFQSVMNPKERRNLGAHYTSETNILKLIKPLFLDELWKEFESIKNNKNKLPEFHKKLSTLKFLDPACGCGNFLVITYRELRLLELEILRNIYKSGQQVIDISDIIWLDVDMMNGIEYEEFPARIAEVAMWLMDHQMNMQISNEFGQYFARLPLKKSAKIINGNALQTDWETVVSKNDLSYILGNPPFIGQQLQNTNQKADILKVFGKSEGSGVLDYVAAWYLISSIFIQNTKIKVAFVSTNSICQGEQAGILWNQLFALYKIKIHFAHQTFNWKNEARGNAAVHCVIVGFANYDNNNKRIFEYENINGIAHEVSVKNINPYLVDGKDFALSSRSKPLNNVPEIKRGNSPYDGGNFLFSEDEKNYFLEQEPNALQFIKKFLGAREFINGINKYCLWLKDAEPQEIKGLPLVLDRVKKVKEFRQNSPGKETQSYASSPTLFRDKNNPDSFIVIPRVSSENRKYIPMGFFDKDYIAGDTCMTIFNGQLFHFGVLNSIMHIAWVKSVCGRLKSDFRYSKDIVYNNFPWPENATDKQIQFIEEKAKKVLDIRTEFPKSSLADLYDSLTMPQALIKAHNELDKAVDLAYRPQPFTSEANRMVYLFELYEKYTANLFTTEKKKKK
ncbi:MAG: methylase [Paludibacter sp.]|nr:methylase [Paludibacter sp.]